MRHTIIIALLLITLFPNTALAQWGFDAVSVEAYINDHKKQRSLLLARSTLEYSNQLLHEYSSEEVGKYKELNVDLDKYTRAFDIIDVMYQSLRTVLNVKSTYQTVSDRISDYKNLLEDFNDKVNSVNADMVYDLTDEELKKLTSNSIKEVPVVQRLELLNGIIKDDFADKILMDTLNSKERIDLHLHPELEQELQQRQQQDEERLLPLEEDETVRRDVLQGDAMVRGEDLALINENKGWYREGAHGREVKVGDIMVEKVPPMEGDKKGEDKYRMTAIINGEAITHEIKQKDYDKFLAVDDYHRMKLFSKVFSEVDMKTRPETNAGLGTKILAALTAGAVVTAEVAHDISHHHHHPAPEFYAEHHGGPRPYFKPGVDSPQEIAARYFEAEANHVATEIRRGY